MMLFLLINRGRHRPPRDGRLHDLIKPAEWIAGPLYAPISGPAGSITTRNRQKSIRRRSILSIYGCYAEILINRGSGTMELPGIDVAGSGIEASMVDIDRGETVGDRHRIATPQLSQPSAVAQVVRQILQHYDGQGPVGVSFPAVLIDGVSITSGNLASDWRGFPIQDYLARECGREFFVSNDTDAAGMAEMKFGAGADKPGLVIVVTIATGLGSGVFTMFS